MDNASVNLSVYLYGYGPFSILFSYACSDYVLDRLSDLFRFNNCPLVHKAYSVLFHVGGLKLTTASRESVRKRFHRFSKKFSLWRGFRDSVAVDEAGEDAWS